VRRFVVLEPPTIGVIARVRRRRGQVASVQPQPRALSETERAEVLRVLHHERFVDQAPASVYANLLDEGRYLCSVPTMYRLLRTEGEVRERRRQATHPASIKPELPATAPTQVWSWDITKLLGPTKWSYFYLYVIIDIFSRYTPGWLLAHRESAARRATPRGDRS
jgi:transposase InsO family protein